MKTVKIKLCGLTRAEDIQAANKLRPDYIGFVFASSSRRYISPAQAAELSRGLVPGIQAVGVFVNAPPSLVAELLNRNIIDLAQLHGDEDEAYIRQLRQLTDKPLIQAFKVRSPQDIQGAAASSADYLLLDSGAGSGQTFDWQWLQSMRRPYFLAGGLGPDNAAAALAQLADNLPYALDVSSGIETAGRKDQAKMAAFVEAVRSFNNNKKRNG